MPQLPRQNFAEEVLFQQGFHACLSRMEQQLQVWVDDASADLTDDEGVPDDS